MRCSAWNGWNIGRSLPIGVAWKTEHLECSIAIIIALTTEIVLQVSLVAIIEALLTSVEDIYDLCATIA